MLYGDRVIRLRKEVANLEKELGDKVTDNEDLFGRYRDVGPQELETLQEEHAALMRRRVAAEDRQLRREEMLREVERIWDADNQARGANPIVAKPERDNSDLFVPEEEFRRTGGN